MTTTASVYFNKIKVDYPQAGKNNDSQGFRDNFRNIFNAFSATNVDLEYLKLNSITLGGNNDFGYNTIKKASFQSCVTKIVDYTPNSASGNIYVDYNESNYQKFSLDPGQTTFYVENWPSNGFAELRLVVVPNSTSTTEINFGGNITKVGYVDLPVVVNSTDVQTFDIWTDNGGDDIYIQGIDLTPTTLVVNTTDVIQSSTIYVSYSQGRYQKFSISTGTSNVVALDWPASTNTVALMNLSFKATTTQYVSTLTFESNSSTAFTIGSQTQPFTISTTATQFFELWTDDGGTSVYVLQKGV